jgi:hypothetical protein
MPEGARIGRAPPARGLAWLGACPAFNERCLNNSASGWSAGTRGASVSWRSRRTRTRPSQRSHHIHEFVTPCQWPACRFRSSSAGAGRPTASQTQPVEVEREASTRVRQILIVACWCCHCPYSDDPKSSTESTIDATTRSAQPLRRGKPAAPSDPSHRGWTR